MRQRFTTLDGDNPHREGFDWQRMADADADTLERTATHAGRYECDAVMHADTSFIGNRTKHADGTWTAWRPKRHYGRDLHRGYTERGGREVCLTCAGAAIRSARPESFRKLSDALDALAVADAVAA